ncbi:MAG: hypothetical protein R3F38_16590 [Gammaproteobacteria bacterium]
MLEEPEPPPPQAARLATAGTSSAVLTPVLRGHTASPEIDCWKDCDRVAGKQVNGGSGENIVGVGAFRLLQNMMAIAVSMGFWCRLRRL